MVNGWPVDGEVPSCSATTNLIQLTLNVRVNSVYLGQYHGCWCPGSLRRQDMSSHDIDYIEYVGPSRIRGSVLKYLCQIYVE